MTNTPAGAPPATAGRPHPLAWCLVVDGDPAARDRLRVLLDLDGVVVLEASGAEEALAALQSAPGGEGCALVALELEAAGPGGLATIALLRWLRPGLPCALVTQDGGTAKAALGGGVDVVLCRPDAPRDCVAALAARLRGARGPEGD